MGLEPQILLHAMKSLKSIIAMSQYRAPKREQQEK